MLAPLALAIMALNLELDSGLGPADFTAMAISLPILVNSLLSLAERAKILCFRFSKMRPIYFRNISTCKPNENKKTSK
jgi:hypothetical protein